MATAATYDDPGLFIGRLLTSGMFERTAKVLLGALPPRDTLVQRADRWNLFDADGLRCLVDAIGYRAGSAAAIAMRGVIEVSVTDPQATAGFGAPGAAA